jgi:hypothetical protein
VYFTRKERKEIVVILLIVVITTAVVTYYCCKDEKDEIIFIYIIDGREKIINKTEGRIYDDGVKESPDLSHLDPTLK